MAPSLPVGAIVLSISWSDKRQAGQHSPAPAGSGRSNGHDGGAKNKAVSNALNFWNRCEAATSQHPYIAAKRMGVDGLRIVPHNAIDVVAAHSIAGWLVVPAWSLSGELRTLQFIPPPGQGRKLNLPGCTFEDGLHIVGEVQGPQRFYICEGIAQAWSCHFARQAPAVVAFGAGRLETVAELIRAERPAAEIILVPDRGKELQARAIAKGVRGLYVELPADKPDNYDVNDFEHEHGQEQLAALLAGAKSPPMRYRLLGAADITAAPPLSWLVRRVLPASGLACIYGQSGTGKSFLALDLCAAVAQGKDWFGHKVSTASVVYAALEGEAGFTNRAKAWQMRMQQDLPQSLRFVVQPFDLRNPDDVRDLADAVIESGSAGGLLVLDTLNRAASGADENSSADMGEIIDAAKSLQAKLGGLVLLVHHSGKDQSRGLRGHSSLHAALDAVIEVSRADDRRSWKVTKSKDESDAEGYQFKLEVVDIGEHADGEPITSCVVVPDHSQAEIRRAIPPKSGNQAVAYQTLAELVRRAVTVQGDSRSGAPLGRPTVSLEHAITAIAERLACEKKRRTERAQQALKGLQAKQLIAVHGGYVWLT